MRTVPALMAAISPLAFPSFSKQAPIVCRAQSDILWAPFDDTESRLAGHERHVEGHYRLGETLQSERANLLGCDASF
jgi:hypothetical protein